MIEFSKQISEKWNLQASLAEQLCVAFDKGDTPYYLTEYYPQVAVEMTIAQVWEIFDFLQKMEDLSSKKKRVLNALKKANRLNPSEEKRVNLTTNAYELDDLLIPLRPNPRSRGQLASKKGLDPLADIVVKQEQESTPVEVMAEEYVGKDPTLSSVNDVIQGVKDILAERFAYDETVRAMCREFTYDDGFIEVVPKNKKDPQYSSYSGKFIPVNELTKDEILKLMIAEDQKVLRLKVGVQLFRITELIRQHFITNPDSTGFDLICEAIDDCWLRLLQPAMERDVKSRLREEAEEVVTRKIVSDLSKDIQNENMRGPLLMVDGSKDKNILFLAVSGKGDLLGATTERKPHAGKTSSSDRLRQFINRHRPLNILILDNDYASVAESILKPITNTFNPEPDFVHFKPVSSKNNPTDSQWMQKEFSSLLDDELRVLYGLALQYLKPITLIPKIGTQYYLANTSQNLITEARFLEIINRFIIEESLKSGVILKDLLDSQLTNLGKCVTSEMLQSIKTADSQNKITSKNDLLKVNGIKEVTFRNIAGFIIIPNAENLLDRTMVHPDFYPWFDEISEQINISAETLITEPETLLSFISNDPVQKIFIEKKIYNQLLAGRRFFSISAPKIKRKLKLNELQEGAIVSGRVTNITPFGVFVNINAVCDGLIHISQLADEYVETPDQVVAINEKVDVKIIKVDVKKRRISLTMKNIGSRSPKVRPSQGQLSNLAEHFKNR